jgi:hypothetical protein
MSEPIRDDIAFAGLIIHLKDGTSWAIDLDGRDAKVELDVTMPRAELPTLLANDADCPLSGGRDTRVNIRLHAVRRPEAHKTLTMRQLRPDVVPFPPRTEAGS